MTNNQDLYLGFLQKWSEKDDSNVNEGEPLHKLHEIYLKGGGKSPPLANP